MTPVDYLPLFTEIFGPRLIDPSKLPRASRSGFSGDTSSGTWFEWSGGTFVRTGSIEKLHALRSELNPSGRVTINDVPVRGYLRPINSSENPFEDF